VGRGRGFGRNNTTIAVHGGRGRGAKTGKTSVTLYMDDPYVAFLNVALTEIDQFLLARLTR